MGLLAGDTHEHRDSGLFTKTSFDQQGGLTQSYVSVVTRFDGAMFAFDDGRMCGMAKAQRRQVKPALSMMEQLRV